MTKHEDSAKWERYTDDGEFQGEMCPRCSAHLAVHDDRKTCGNCGYTKHQ